MITQPRWENAPTAAGTSSERRRRAFQDAGTGHASQRTASELRQGAGPCLGWLRGQRRAQRLRAQRVVLLRAHRDVQKPRDAWLFPGLTMTSHASSAPFTEAFGRPRSTNRKSVAEGADRKPRSSNARAITFRAAPMIGRCHRRSAIGARRRSIAISAAVGALHFHFARRDVSCFARWQGQQGRGG